MSRALLTLATVAVALLVVLSLPLGVFAPTPSTVTSSFTVNAPGTAGGAPRPVTTNVSATSGSVVNVVPASRTFTAGRTVPQAFTACVWAAPLGTPPAGVVNAYMDVSIGPGSDAGVSSFIRYTPPLGGQAQSGTGFSASTPASGCISFTVHATADGDDDITIRVLTSRFWVPGTSAFSWGWSSFLEVKKDYETVNQ